MKMAKKQKNNKNKEKENKKINKERQKKETKNLESTLEDKYTKQIKYVVIVMFCLLSAFFVSIWLINESKTFRYAGLDFKKIKFGELPLFHAKIPITSITGDLVAEYNLYLREDPRKLDIPIQGKIRLKKTIIQAVNKSIKCPLEGVAGVNFGQFLRAAGIKKIDGTTNLTKSQEENIPFVSCEQEREESILIITEGEETKITQEAKNCYVIEFADCELLQAIERFMVGIIANSKGYEV